MFTFINKLTNNTSLSFGRCLPSITLTDAKSKGETPSMQATFTPYSCGGERL